MWSSCAFLEESENHVVKIRAVGAKVLHLSGEKTCAEGEGIDDEFFLKEALYSIADVRYTNVRETLLCDSSLQTRVEAS